MCIDIVEIWFGIANGQILSNFDRIVCPRQAHFFSFRTIACKYQGILTKLGISIDIKEIWFEIANGQISSMLASCNLSKLSADPDQTLLVWVCIVFQCPSPGFTDNSDVTVTKIIMAINDGYLNIIQMRGLILSVSDNHMNNNLKEILVYIYIEPSLHDTLRLHSDKNNMAINVTRFSYKHMVSFYWSMIIIWTSILKKFWCMHFSSIVNNPPKNCTVEGLFGSIV